MGFMSRYKEHGPRVFIAIPTMGVLHQRLVGLLIQLTRQHRNGLHITMVSQAVPVDYARNHLVEEFLKTDLDWLLMIDSDIVPPDNVLDLTKHGKQIVGGVCLSLINGKLKSTIFKETDSASDGTRQYVQHDYMNDLGLVQVDSTGTGCLAIHRDVFKKLDKPYFEFTYHAESRKIRTGEDIRFCEKARDAGFTIHVDKSVSCSHFKDCDLAWVNREVVNYMSKEKVDALVDGAIQRRIKQLELNQDELAVAPNGSGLR